MNVPITPEQRHIAIRAAAACKTHQLNVPETLLAYESALQVCERERDESRIAFEVMERRGWNPTLIVNGERAGLWIAVGDMTASARRFMEWNKEHAWPDPRTAILEAEKWYQANVEPSRARTDSPAPAAASAVESASEGTAAGPDASPLG